MTGMTIAGKGFLTLCLEVNRSRCSATWPTNKQCRAFLFLLIVQLIDKRGQSVREFLRHGIPRSVFVHDVLAAELVRITTYLSDHAFPVECVSEGGALRKPRQRFTGRSLFRLPST